MLEKSSELLAVRSCMDEFSSKAKAVNDFMSNMVQKQTDYIHAAEQVSETEANYLQKDYIQDYVMGSNTALSEFISSNEQTIKTLTSLAFGNPYAKVALFKMHACELFPLNSNDEIYKAFELNRDPLLGVWHLANAAAIKLDSAIELFEKIISEILDTKDHPFEVMLKGKIEVRDHKPYLDELAKIIAISKNSKINNLDIPYQDFNVKHIESQILQHTPGSSPTKSMAL